MCLGSHFFIQKGEELGSSVTARLVHLPETDVFGGAYTMSFNRFTATGVIFRHAAPVHNHCSAAHPFSVDRIEDRG